MDDAERQHLTDIAHDLASDAPRLAYADWLLARGRGYGEFVRKSIACAKLSEAKQAAASKALDALLKAHGKDGLGAAYPFVTRKATLFERGFPTSALATAAKFFKAGEEAALRLPGASLTLSDVNEKDVRGLLAMPRIFAGGELHLTAMGDGALTDVSASPALACFRLVRLHASNTFGQPGLEAFARSPHGSALRLLMVDKALDFTPLFASTAFPKLSNLTLGARRLTGLEKNQLRLDFLKLEELVDFDDADAENLASTASGQTLRQLSMARADEARDTPVRVSGRAIVDMVAAMPKLRDLWLHEFRLGADTLKEIEKVLNARRGTLYNRDAPLRESEAR